MDLTGYIASIFIGITLGLVGSGGSILTIPVLVYLFHIDAVVATVYSLFIVGTTSLAGSFAYFRKGMIQIKTALAFGLPSVLSVLLTRVYIVPAIPRELFFIGRFLVTKELLVMVLFAVLMLFASYSMIRKDKQVLGEPGSRPLLGYPAIFVQGLFVGAVTGFIGAGGGFLIIPVLVNLLRLPIKTAVGTSLVIISINSLSGFLFSIGDTELHWPLLFSIALVAILGIVLGSRLSSKIDGKKLKPALGWFVFVMGIYILFREILGK